MSEIDPVDHERSVRPRAEAGDPAAMAGLGWALFEQGNDAESERWYERAAQAGDLAGMTGVGFMLNRRGAHDEAWRWWRRAAVAGDVQAMANLAANPGSAHREEAQQWGWRAEAARRGAHPDEVPADVRTAAADLGALQVTLGRDALPSGAADIGCGLVLALIPAAIGVVLIAAGASAGWAVLCLVLAAAVPILFAFGVRATRGDVPERAFVFERGLVWGDHKGALTVLPWSRVRLLRNVRRIDRNGRYERTDYAYTVVHDDGTRLILHTPKLPQGHLFVLGDTIEREIVASRVPRALTAIADGRQLAFGGLAVDATGISAGKDTLPWREVEEIEVTDQLRIKRRDGWVAWASARVADVPDVAVLLVVAETLRGSERDRRSLRP
ncbi:DUF6585 family protein [Pseudonocardia sp. GCM10023141]|uniref:DUF6585 family protein n=1 Tax=Pseudonocardia sp. GCM10023141 TaxID=3252653 RepID=UPI00361413A4